MSGSLPISRVLDVLGLTDSSCAVCSHDRSATTGILIDGGLSNFSCCRRRGSRGCDGAVSIGSSDSKGGKADTSVIDTM